MIKIKIDLLDEVKNARIQDIIEGTFFGKNMMLKMVNTKTKNIINLLYFVFNINELKDFLRSKIAQS